MRVRFPRRVPEGVMKRITVIVIGIVLALNALATLAAAFPEDPWG